MPPVFRFAPSPNGELHLGHARSALINQRLAQEAAGRFLLRIEDIDLERCTPAFEAAIYRDLAWLGIAWEEPVRRQSEHFADYAAALDRLKNDGLVYPAFMSRGEVRDHIAGSGPHRSPWPRDPDGAPHYPDVDRLLSKRERARRIASGEAHAWRLDMGAALARLGSPPEWREEGAGPLGESGVVTARPQDWGDVVLARSDTPASYHLAVVVDDALQGVTHVVRGRDLFYATAVHRVLQALLGLPAPLYRHHGLVADSDGRKLSKSRRDTGIAALRDTGVSAAEVRRMAMREGD
jgi:glutamyl-Q tRNA(Asp) synthetase